MPETVATGRPLPFRQFIIKVHSRCNLACDYCYVYEMADQSWRSRPRTMSVRTIDRAAARIGEHVQRHELSTVTATLHGGEPLLAGAEFIAYAARTLRGAAGHADVDLAVQTNALLLTESMVRTLAEHRVRIGISLDGGAVAHDRHRTYRNGQGSYAATADRLRELIDGPHRSLFSGVLCTIDIANDPVRVYEDLLSFAPPMMDFLLPHATWDQPPAPGPDGSPTPYGDWLVAIFDRWYGAPTRETRIRLFEEILSLVLGGASRVESIGLSPVQLVVIETDGSLEQVDTLKAAYDGAPDTGYDVFRHAFDELLTHPAIVARHGGLAALCQTCQRCPIVSVCGGGYYPHRYRTGAGFLNPSVYCHDLQRLITHIRDRVAADLDSLRRTVP